MRRTLKSQSPSAAGEATVYPLWDGVESVEQYAKRVNLPPTQALDLWSHNPAEWDAALAQAAEKLEEVTGALPNEGERKDRESVNILKSFL